MRSQFRGTNLTVFALFFLLAMLEALGKRNWGLVTLWLLFALMFLRADFPRRSKDGGRQT